ncbi:MAG TPA: hypothetical protein VH593_28030 [Ktedonobacteraceae bacterium]
MSAFKGADVIVRKTRQLIARRLVGPDHTPGDQARHEWLYLAHDDIGPFEVPCYFHC